MEYQVIYDFRSAPWEWGSVGWWLMFVVVGFTFVIKERQNRATTGDRHLLNLMFFVLWTSFAIFGTTLASYNPVWDYYRYKDYMTHQQYSVVEGRIRDLHITSRGPAGKFNVNNIEFALVGSYMGLDAGDAARHSLRNGLRVKIYYITDENPFPINVILRLEAKW